MAVRAALTSAVTYQDPRAALDWLAKVLGFERFMLIEDNQGNVVHAEMSFGGSLLMVGGEWNEDRKSPRSIGGKMTQTIHVHLDADLDAHCERVRAAGGEIVMEPADQFYGDRTYQCRDPEGHVWSISQTVKPVSREEAETASGLKITGWM